MFSCCVPVSHGCRLGGARGRDASRPWRQWVRSCTGRLRSLAHRDPKKSTDEIGKRLAESRFTCPTELRVCPVAQEGHAGPVERVAAVRFWEAGPGVGLGRPPPAPRPRRKVFVHRSWDQYLESPESEPEGEKAGGRRWGCTGPGWCGATLGGAPGGWCGARSGLRAPGCGLQGAEVLVWAPGRGFSGRLRGELCLCKGPWRGRRSVGGGPSLLSP
ncbi:uncharacterized protein LOC123592430 isoform X2 [Leopardus geoffroyi]|uniref:uncharacterized protein LOC123592430 isoform X2 n=1 Tax=Leopardus geoffroyi TaxID=46844 RepID=UPI001E260818|nr:uncharacterized protein LOC123592430 isoform X2 [Leopardus geoffroyi]